MKFIAGQKVTGQAVVNYNRFNKSFLLQTNRIPLLALPKSFNYGGFRDSRITFKSEKNVMNRNNPRFPIPETKTVEDIIYLPKVDEILGEYGKTYISARFTSDFINLTSYRAFALSFAIEALKLLNNGTIENEDETRKTVNYYLGNSAHILELNNFTNNNKKTYLEKLEQIRFTYQNQQIALSQASAEDFINQANAIIDENLKNDFARTKPQLDQIKIEDTKTNESPYYTIDPNIIISPEAKNILDLIGAEYFKQTGKRFNVNSGTRDPYRQAEAMYVKYPGDKTFSEYRNRPAINEILEAIRKAQKAGQSRAQIVKAMGDVIKSQVERGIYISSHLKAGAIDISVFATAETPEPDKKLIISIAKKVTGGQAFEETNPPHIHIQYK